MIDRCAIWRDSCDGCFFVTPLTRLAMNDLARCRAFPFKPVSWFVAVLGGLTISLAAAHQAQATGGPENVLLVVNSLSPDSMCIANHYAELRHIPPFNFLFLDWDPKQDTTDVNTFRKKILSPVLQAARIPIPGRQIDYVVYSSDFPWGIGIGDDIKRFKDKAEQGSPDKPAAKSPVWTAFTPVASINGLTYLWEAVLTGNDYLLLRCNWYARTGAPEQAKEPTLGFSSAAAYGPHGELATAGAARRYLLSMMLGVTVGRGNTRAEVLGYLKRSAAADGTHPRGTIYFVQNGDIRSKVRQAGFPDAVRILKTLGVAAEVLEGQMPEGKDDVQGAMLGVASFNWKASRSTILPGAICEHFTSFGGEMPPPPARRRSPNGFATGPRPAAAR